MENPTCYVALALGLGFGQLGCDSAPTERERQQQVLETWASGYRAAGEALQAVESWSALAPALDTAAVEISDCSEQLAALEARGYPASRPFVAALGDLAGALRSTADAMEREDLAAAAEGAAQARAHLIAAGTVETAAIRAGYREGAADLRSAEMAARAAGNPAVADLLDKVVSTPADEYARRAETVASLTDPELREWLELDSPEAQEGLEWLTSGSGVEELQELGAELSNLVGVATRERFTEGFSKFGGSLVAIATGTGATGVQFFSVWGDDCSPEGAKRNCALGDIAITLCGHTPDDIEQILEFADKLPFGHVAIRAALLIHRITSTSDIYFECAFERCDDTYCPPVVGTELEWVEHEEWIHVTNEGQDDVGAGGCWAPQLWSGPDRVAFQNRLREVLVDECGCQ